MEKFIVFLKSYVFECLAALAIAVIAAILAATSHEHGLLIAIFLGFTVVAFMANSVGYDGSSKLAHAGFAILFVLCLISMVGVFETSLARPQQWQRYLALLMAGINFLNIAHSAKIIQRIVRNQGREYVANQIRSMWNQP